MAIDVGDALIIVSCSRHSSTFYFPKELMAEILTCLPVKSLLRFRCISKHWRSYIDSTWFVKKYLERSIDSSIIVGDEENFYLAGVDSLDNSTVMKVADPVKAQISGAKLVGSCNGLVCLCKNEKDVILWNPATNKCRKLPEPTDILIPSSSTFGFGYDHRSDDYNVVRTFGTRFHGIMVTIYSLKSNSWTQAENITSEIHLRLVSNFGKFVNGALYWLAVNSSCIIFAFDLGVRRHRELPFPASVNKNLENAMGLMVFDGCLCIVEFYINSRMDIWVNRYCGGENSWIKLLSLEQPHMLKPDDTIWPVAFSKTRKDVLLEVHCEKFMWYNLERNEFKNVTVHGIPDTFGTLVYTQSLVQVTDNSKSKVKKMSKFLSKGFNLKL